MTITTTREVKSPKVAYEHAMKHGPSKDVEEIILRARKTQWIRCYAHEVLKARWPEGEAIILELGKKAIRVLDKEVGYSSRSCERRDKAINDLHEVLAYAQYVVRAKWPEAEEVMLCEPTWGLRYVETCLRGRRWSELEAVLLSGESGGSWYPAELLFKYAKEVVKGRWPEAETGIRKDKRTAYWYEKEIIPGYRLKADGTGGTILVRTR